LIAESVRAGLYCLVQIKNVDQHRDYFKSLQEDFKAIGIVIDPSCSDPVRARYYSHDENYYLNESATIYNKILKPIIKPVHAPIKPTVSTNELFNRCLNSIESNHIDITSASRKDWLKIASAIASEFGAGGLEYFHRISCFYPDYNPKETEKTFNYMAKDPKCHISTFFSICKDYGVSYMK
jgi:hypothetical protein